MSTCHFCGTDTSRDHFSGNQWFPAGTGTPSTYDADYGGHYERVSACPDHRLLVTLAYRSS